MLVHCTLNSDFADTSYGNAFSRLRADIEGYNNHVVVVKYIDNNDLTTFLSPCLTSTLPGIASVLKPAKVRLHIPVRARNNQIT